MISYDEMERQLFEYREAEQSQIDEYKAYLEKHRNDSKLDYVSQIFVTERILHNRDISAMAHDRFSLPNYHSHSFMEITYILGGEFVNTVEGQELTMHKGDISVLPPQVYHSFDAAEKDVEKRKACCAINVFIEKGAIGKYLSGCGNEHFERFVNGIVNGDTHRKFAFFTGGDSSVSERLLKLLYYCLRRSRSSLTRESESLCENIARSLIYEMLNTESYSLSFSNSFYGNSSSTPDIIHFITRNYKNLTLAAVAENSIIPFPTPQSL